MDETAQLVIFVGGMILAAIVGGVIGWKLNLWRKQKFVNNLSDVEKKRWERLEKYRVSRGGYKKGVAIMIGVLVLFMIMPIFFSYTIGIRMTMFLAVAIFFIPVLIILARSVFKTRNPDQIISFIMCVWLCMALGLVGLGYKYAWYVFWFGWVIFIGEPNA